MPTPCWLKHLCSIRALVPVSFFLSFSLYFWLISWNAKAGCVTQEILASLLLSLSHCRLRTTRFQSIKWPQQSFNSFIPYSCWVYNVADQRNVRILHFIFFFNCHYLNLTNNLPFMEILWSGRCKEKGERKTLFLLENWSLDYTSPLVLHCRLNPDYTCLLRVKGPHSKGNFILLRLTSHLFPASPHPRKTTPLTCGRAPTLRGHCWRSGPPLSHVPLPLSQKDGLLKAQAVPCSSTPRSSAALAASLPSCSAFLLFSTHQRMSLGKGPAATHSVVSVTEDSLRLTRPKALGCKGKFLMEEF